MPAFTITPFFRSPFTDLTQAVVNAQHYDKCGKMEIRMMECYEAYGVVKGDEKCKDLVDDFNECFAMNKQSMRTEAMRIERHKQWWRGDLPEHYQKPGPRVDSF